MAWHTWHKWYCWHAQKQPPGLSFSGCLRPYVAMEKLCGPRIFNCLCMPINFDILLKPEKNFSDIWHSICNALQSMSCRHLSQLNMNFCNVIYYDASKILFNWIFTQNLEVWISWSCFWSRTDRLGILCESGFVLVGTVCLFFFISKQHTEHYVCVDCHSSSVVLTKQCTKKNSLW